MSTYLSMGAGLRSLSSPLSMTIEFKSMQSSCRVRRLNCQQHKSRGFVCCLLAFLCICNSNSLYPFECYSSSTLTQSWIQASSITHEQTLSGVWAREGVSVSNHWAGARDTKLPLQPPAADWALLFGELYSGENVIHIGLEGACKSWGYCLFKPLTNDSAGCNLFLALEVLPDDISCLLWHYVPYYTVTSLRFLSYLYIYLGHFYNRFTTQLSKSLSVSITPLHSLICPTFQSPSPFSPPVLASPYLSKILYFISPSLEDPLLPAGLLANISPVVTWIEVHITKA